MCNCRRTSDEQVWLAGLKVAAPLDLSGHSKLSCLPPMKQGHKYFVLVHWYSEIKLHIFMQSTNLL